MEKEKIECPQWLIDRMERLKKLPPPTKEQMERQFKASAEWSRTHSSGDVDKVKKSDYIR